MSKITKDVGNISHDSNEYYCSLKVIQSFYADRGDYENAIETAKKCLNTAPEKERADCCYDISDYYRILGDFLSQREWLEKSHELLEKKASLSSSKKRQQLDIIQKLESLYLDSGDYKNATYYRSKYNSLIQREI